MTAALKLTDEEQALEDARTVLGFIEGSAIIQVIIHRPQPDGGAYTMTEFPGKVEAALRLAISATARADAAEAERDAAHLEVLNVRHQHQVDTEALARSHERADRHSSAAAVGEVATKMHRERAELAERRLAEADRLLASLCEAIGENIDERLYVLMDEIAIYRDTRKGDPRP